MEGRRLKELQAFMDTLHSMAPRSGKGGRGASLG
jgi:hypothetical protein